MNINYGSGNDSFILDLILGGWDFAISSLGQDIALTLSVLSITAPIVLLFKLFNK